MGEPFAQCMPTKEKRAWKKLVMPHAPPRGSHDALGSELADRSSRGGRRLATDGILKTRAQGKGRVLVMFLETRKWNIKTKRTYVGITIALSTQEIFVLRVWWMYDVVCSKECDRRMAAKGGGAQSEKGGGGGEREKG